ncbi:MAG: hypothetical protein JXA74_11190, partial [Anaerolineae bacterium]|nr:hypothetical protein [Anaerolineae bacterium]
MDDATAVLDVARLYGLSPARLRPDLEIAGSPERCEYRAVIEDQRGKLYLVESLFEHTRARKVQIADALAALHREGLGAVHPYLADVRGEQVTRYGDGFWQIMPYIEGVPLPRPEWVGEAWRGLALADFLLGMRQAADRLHLGRGWPIFSLSAYIA